MSVTTIHPNFVSNQLLTSTQLNQLFEYLDEQDRLSRIKLTGNGIVCGLGWQLTSENTILINEGYGLSSDGYLISLKSNTYTHYREYIDPDVDDPDLEISSPLYLQWKKTGSLKGQVEGILELEKTANEGNSELSPAQLTNTILVIYLERKTVDLTSCLVTDCDNKGSNIHFTPRVILVPQNILDAVDVCPAAPVPLRLPRLHTEVNLSDVNVEIDINQAYYNIASSFKTPLFDAITDALDSYAIFIDLDDDWSWLDKLTDWYEQVSDGADVNQYFFEITKILVRAYNELNQAACNLLTECNADFTFPRHLMLGHMDGDNNYRNIFRPSPIQNVAQGKLQTVRLLFNRIRSLVEELPEHELLLKSEEVIDLRIIPSNTDLKPLGETAVPWYYSGKDEIKKIWQPAGCCTTDPVWSYDHSEDIDLDYNNASLLRVEGHIGISCDVVVSKLEILKKNNNLEFCVQSLNLKDSDNKQLATLNIKIIEHGKDLFDTRREYRVALIHALADSQISEVERKKLSELNDKVKELTEKQFNVYKRWGKLRCSSSILCNPAELDSSYQNFRCNLIGQIAAVNSALLDFPLSLNRNIKERLELGEMEPVLIKYVMLKSSEISDDIKFLLKLLPQRFCEFNNEIFSSTYQMFINNLIEYQYLLPHILIGYAGKENKINAEIIIDISSALADMTQNIQQQIEVYKKIISSNTYSCLATLYIQYEEIRRLNKTWFKYFAGLHTGMEALFSVEKGGTFILVCDDDKKVVADFALSNCISCCCKVFEKGICLPPVTKPDYVSVTLVTDNKPERLSFKPVTLIVDVLKNDYSLLDAESSEITIKLLESDTELGGVISLKDGKIHYFHEKPEPYRVDRFTYLLKEESKKCENVATGHVSIYFAPPIEDQKFGEIEGYTLANNDDANNVKVTIQETGQSVFSERGGNEVGGYFIFQHMPYGAYTLIGEYKGGFESDPVEVVVDGTNKPVHINYWTFSRDINFDANKWTVRIVDTTGSTKEVANNNLLTVLAEHRKTQLEAVDKADEKESVKVSPAYESARKFITDSVAVANVTSEALQVEYKDVSGKLIKAIDNSTAEDQKIYQELLKSASMGYMDRLYFIEDAVSSLETDKALKNISRNVKKSGLDINIVKEEWGGKIRDELKLPSVDTMIKKL